MTFASPCCWSRTTSGRGACARTADSARPAAAFSWQLNKLSPPLSLSTKPNRQVCSLKGFAELLQFCRRHWTSTLPSQHPAIKHCLSKPPGAVLRRCCSTGCMKATKLLHKPRAMYSVWTCTWQSCSWAPPLPGSLLFSWHPLHWALLWHRKLFRWNAGKPKLQFICNLSFGRITFWTLSLQWILLTRD